MITFGKRHPNCATCRFWCGKRDWDLTRNHVAVTRDERGACAGPNGSQSPRDTIPMETCRKWESQQT